MDNIGVFGTFGRKTLAIMLICIGDGIRDSLFKRSDDAQRKQSIYSQISFNCYAVRDSNTGQNIVKS